MLALMINSKKYLTLNLSKGPKFIFTFIHPNFIGKVAQKTALLIHRHGSKTRQQVLISVFLSTVTL